MEDLVMCDICRGVFPSAPAVSWKGGLLYMSESPITVIERTKDTIMYTCNKCQDISERR